MTASYSTLLNLTKQNGQAGVRISCCLKNMRPPPQINYGITYGALTTCPTLNLNMDSSFFFSKDSRLIFSLSIAVMEARFFVRLGRVLAMRTRTVLHSLFCFATSVVAISLIFVICETNKLDVKH